ncbi:TonB-dependent receptor [Thioalkalicoccus limnaeus]|uniref:TonB-dependent receptor n=1 Tax=Thioalkalicoccus limnaeus TaxID=120681 RepID=A0ABV4BL56_9GAMM
MHRSNETKLTMALVLAGLFGWPWPVSWATEASNAAILNKVDAMEMPILTVTARIGEESLAEVPFSVSVVGGHELETRRLTSFEQVLRQSPGVDVSSWGGANDANIRIRGVGSMWQVSADDNSVVLNLDGVPVSGRHAALGAFDVERVEVLKGPQGTLFGRNSLAGAINVTSRRPTRELEGHVRLEGGQEGQQLQEAAIGGPLSGTLMARLAVQNAGSDNPIENLGTGKPLTYQRDQAARASLLWEPNARTSALLIGEYQRLGGYVGSMILRPYADPPAVDLSPDLIDGNEKTFQRYSLELNHDLAGSRVTSLTSLASTDLAINKAYDAIVMEALYGLPMAYPAADEGDERVFNQDLRWASLPGARIFWVLGLNILRSERDFDSRDFVTGATADRRFETDSEALYGEITYPLTEAWKVTGGWRHSWEDKTYDARYANRNMAGVTDDRRRSTDRYDTGRVALSYAWTPGTNLYAVASRGYKSGGFNDYATQPADSEPYDPAVSDAFELGFKSRSADGRLTLSGAAFYNQVKDDHLLGYDYQTMATQALNADTRSHGAELEGEWRVGRGLTLSGGFSYVDATITSDVADVQGGPVASGNRVPDVPYWSSLITVSYQRALGDLAGLPAPVLNADLSYRYMGTRPADPQNHFDLDAYHKLDLRLGVLLGAAEVYLWADNLLDEAHDLYGYWFTPTVQVGAPSRGRTFGVGASYLF